MWRICRKSKRLQPDWFPSGFALRGQTEVIKLRAAELTDAVGKVNMSKAIMTKYHGPTNRRGSRISARDCDGNKATISFPYELNDEGRHRKAAAALCEKMHWSGAAEMIGGGTSDGWAFVFAPERDVVNPDEHQGWRNYETWAVWVSISHDRNRVAYWNGRAAICFDAAVADKTFTRIERASLDLSDELQHAHEACLLPHMPDFAQDLLNSGLGSVNWYEIGKHLIEELNAQEVA